MALDFRYIRWLLGHMDEAERIFSAVQVAIAEPDLKAKVLAMHPVLDALAEIVNEETGLAPEAVELDKSFTEDLDIDSISMMTIVVNAEEKFGVRIPDEEVKNLKTVGDAVSFIAGAQA